MPKYANLNVYGLRKRARSPPPKKTSYLTSSHSLHRSRAQITRHSSASKLGYSYRLNRPHKYIPKSRFTKASYRSNLCNATIRRVSKKAYATTKTRVSRGLGASGQSLSLGAEWHYEPLSVTRESIIYSTVDSVGKGVLGFGVNLSPT
jgi:hypothetical protein